MAGKADPSLLSARRRWPRRWLWLLGLLCCPAALLAETADPQAVRAAMVFNFLKFTEWPAGAGERGAGIRLCVASGDPREVAALESLEGKQLRGRPLTVVRLAGRVAECQVLYVDSRQRWVEALDSGAVGHTLTVSAYAGFVRDGGMIEMMLQDGATRFDINLGEARRAELRFYPQLLKLARQLVE